MAEYRCRENMEWIARKWSEGEIIFIDEKKIQLIDPKLSIPDGLQLGPFPEDDFVVFAFKNALHVLKMDDGRVFWGKSTVLIEAEKIENMEAIGGVRLANREDHIWFDEEFKSWEKAQHVLDFYTYLTRKGYGSRIQRIDMIEETAGHPEHGESEDPESGDLSTGRQGSHSRTNDADERAPKTMGSSLPKRTDRDQASAFRAPFQFLQWSQVRMRFVNGETITLFDPNGTGARDVTFAMMGKRAIDGRRKPPLPTTAWNNLRKLAENHGQIELEIKKRKQRLSMMLREFFEIDEDPLEYIEQYIERAKTSHGHKSSLQFAVHEKRLYRYKARFVIEPEA